MQLRNIELFFLPIVHGFGSDEGHVEIAGALAIRIETLSVRPSLIRDNTSSQGDAGSFWQSTSQFITEPLEEC